MRPRRIPQALGRVYYGWWIVLATQVICMLGFGTWLYSFGVFFKPMMNEFGWTRAMTSGAASLRSIQGGVANPVVGWAVDKYGARIVIIIGALISGFAFALASQINSLWSFYLIYGILLSVGMSAMLYIPAWTVIAKWFRRKLSLANAVLATGAGIGGLICAPAAAMLIQKVGWRWTFFAAGVVIVVIVIPLAMVVRERPEDMGLRPDGDPPVRDGAERAQEARDPHENGGEVVETSDYTLGEAFRSAAFWILCLAFFFQFMANSMVFVHTIPHLTDVGISLEKASAAFGLLTMVSVIGRLSFGYLGDFLDKRYLFICCYMLMSAGILVLMNAKDMAGVYLFIALFGVGYGGPVPLMAAIRAEYFGRAALGKIQGFMTPVTMLAGFAGPMGAGYLFDTTGSYRLSFLLASILVICSAGVILCLKPQKAGADPVRPVKGAGADR